MFYIYFHNDFDGIASSAIFTKFLKLENITIKSEVKYIPVDYELKSTWIENSLLQPCAVLDFLYHPMAEWWFDHHATTFLDKSVTFGKYERNNKKFWNVNFSSCPSLLISHFNKFYKNTSLTLRKSFKELIHWSNIIDGALYKSPDMLYDSSYTFININKTLGIERSQDYRLFLMDIFIKNDIDSLLKNKKYQELISQIKNIEYKSIEIQKKITFIKNNIAFFDQSDYDIPFQRFLTYYLFPEVLYRVGIYRKDDKYSVSINYNIWHTKENKINLGKLCRQIGGGGRFNVGAVIVNTHEEARNKSEFLFNTLLVKTAEQIKLFQEDNN